MGQNFSHTTFQAGSAGLDTPELSDLVYEKSMGSASRLMKSIRSRHHDGVVLVKVFIKPYLPMTLVNYRKAIVRERKALSDVPNALAYQRIIETETNGYLVRQYFSSSLYDRVSTRPFLEDIEKKWLAFQLLCALRDCHAKDVYHGDIKSENILVTSWNWLYLSDFSSSFKPATLPEDNPATFTYYFDTASRRTCYLAPERFLPAGASSKSDVQVTWAMDVFSAGCVIAELFLEAPIFNLAQMFAYKQGNYDPVKFHLDRIVDKDIRELITHMIQVEPEHRYSAEQYLDLWRQRVFPDYFYSFLHQYMALVTDPSSGRYPISGALSNLGESDERIDRIYYDFDKISYFLGYGNEKQESQTPQPSKTGLGLFPVQLNIPNNEHQASILTAKPSGDGTLIFLTLVVSSIRHTARATSRVRACDLLLAFAERLTDEVKLDRILPYLVLMLTDESDIVKIAAMRTVTQLLALVTVVSPVNANIFPEYIFKKTRDFLLNSEKSPTSLVRATYAGCLGSLANTAASFLGMVATLRADGTLPTADPDVEDGDLTTAAIHHDLYDNARAELVELFESHTKELITDRDSTVRRAFLGSVPDLCMFFGTAESNDIILTHLNTYLNDRDWMLKCAFFDNIVGVATFLGSISLEEFILPLMIQALTDAEEYVVERVLRSLASMAELGLFQRSTTWEIIDVVARFTMHPNIWIREASTMFISTSTKYLSKADIRCIILPLIKPYLKIGIQSTDELDLLDALKKPLSRPVFESACTWANRVERGLFWKPVKQLRTFSFGSSPQTMPTISSKDLTHNALRQIPRNEEDEQWLVRLRALGMTAEDEFKLVALREYIWRTARQHPIDLTARLAQLNGIQKLRDHKVALTTVMFDEDQPLDEPLRNIKPEVEGGQKGHTIADALLDASMTIDDSISRRKRSAYNTHKARLSNSNAGLLGLHGFDARGSPIDPSPIGSPPPETSSALSADAKRRLAATSNEMLSGQVSDDDSSSVADTLSSVGQRHVSHDMRHHSSAISLLSRKDTIKSLAETSTTSTNAFGRVEGPFTQSTSQPSALVMAKDQQQAALANNVRFRAAHSYTGNDPSILQMLDSMYAENYPKDLLEFGPVVTPISKRKTVTRSAVPAVEKSWRPEGILVAGLSEHTGPVTRIAVAPDHVFFITGGDDGNVKIWDTARLEKNLTHKARQTHKHNDAKVSSICFVENTHCFVSAGSDGSINVTKVEYASGRYGKSRLLREFQLPVGEFAVWSDHFKSDANSTLILATNRSRIVAIDLREKSMKLLYSLENPVHHGTPTCFLIDKKRHWLLLGTSHGVLDLWDLRFKMRVKAWGIPGATAIHRLVLHPSIKGRGKWVCVAGGSGQGEVTVWDIEKAQCREVYRTGSTLPNSATKNYEPWPVDDDRPEGMLGRFATSIENNPTGHADRGIRAMVVGVDSHEDGRESKNGFLVTGGSDKRIRFWDLAHVENSIVVSGLEADESKPAFSASHPKTTLTINAEKQMRPAVSNAGSTNGSAGTKADGKGSPQSGGTNGSAGGRPPRSTVISAQQQQLLKSHLDSILDVALLESPYGMTVSVDRSGCMYVFQ